MGSQTDVFRRMVRDHMGLPPPMISGDTETRQVMAFMREVGATAVVITAPNGTPAGIVTEQDVTRRIACVGVETVPIRGLMSSPLLTVPADALLYVAIGLMRRHRLRHMPVQGTAGQLVGMLDLTDALALATAPLTGDIDRLTHEDTREGLRAVKAAQVDVAERLFAEHVPAPEIQALISDINNDIYRRVLKLLVAELVGQGRGGPPVPFNAIVMGSGGRGESYLFPDQDNGFLLADYPDEEHGRIDAWFIELAERMTRALDDLRFPYCAGHVMATNPLWRKTLPQWKSQIGGSLARRDQVVLLFCDILFDFRPVYGEFQLALDLRDWVTGQVGMRPRFLYDMFGLQAGHHAGIGLFGRLLTERQNPAHRGEMNLKLHATLPLAEAVRLMALRARIPATGTLQRIDRLREMGELTSDEADRLSNVFAFITGLQLRRQIADFRAERPVSNFVDPRQLIERERDLLRDSLRQIRDLRARIRVEMAGRPAG
jgi:signal-transduction protein with cAMP-binding, CBS, and nucleotidyltransferase domain